MVTEEKELRKAANNLILVLTMSEQWKQGLDSFEALLFMTDYEQRIFENPAAMSPFSRITRNRLLARAEPAMYKSEISLFSCSEPSSSQPHSSSKSLATPSKS